MIDNSSIIFKKGIACPSHISLNNKFIQALTFNYMV